MNKSLLSFLAICFVVLVTVPSAHAKQFNALLFTKTSGWHHESINAGVTALRKMAEENYFDLQWHADANRITDKHLKKFDVIIFLSTTGDILNDNQQSAVERFIQSGKGFVGIHSASDTEYQWAWYQKLIGRSFVTHPKIQTAKLKVLNSKFAGLGNMPDEFLWTDEWYQFSGEHTEKLHYLLSVDESSYKANFKRKTQEFSGMGSFHPVAWYQHYDGGRAFYTGLGHMDQHYENPFFLTHLFGGIYWAATSKVKE